MLRSIFFRSRPPLLRKGGVYARLNYDREKNTRQTLETPRTNYRPYSAVLFSAAQISSSFR